MVDFQRDKAVLSQKFRQRPTHHHCHAGCCSKSGSRKQLGNSLCTEQRSTRSEHPITGENKVKEAF